MPISETGLVRPPAKGVWGKSPIEGSNPSASAVCSRKGSTLPDPRRWVRESSFPWLHAGLLERDLDAVFGLRARAEDPAVRFLDLQVVDARLAALHQALCVELPQLVAIAAPPLPGRVVPRSEEHTSELQSLMRTPYAVF